MLIAVGGDAGITLSITSSGVESALLSPVPAQLSDLEMDLLLVLAGWPEEWRAAGKAIAWCESKFSPGAIGDAGRSLGIFQLWTGWFWDGEDPHDPLTNARVALRVRETRGRFGGGGGWSCARIVGVE